MPAANPTTSLANQRAKIASKLRDLRRERQWTQARLATELGLSQNRLSEIERGAGSLSAEQLIRVLTLFNVPLSSFVDAKPDPERQLQNALARLGATDLHESTEVLLSELLTDASRAIREALITGAPRLVTAIAPVLVRHARTLNLRGLQAELQVLGFPHRLPWVVDNTLRAVELLGDRLPHSLRASVATIRLFRDQLSHNATPSAPPDILDPSIRSTKTAETTARRGSDTSRSWGIVSALTPEDFVVPLRSALEAD